MGVVPSTAAIRVGVIGGAIALVTLIVSLAAYALVPFVIAACAAAGLFALAARRRLACFLGLAALGGVAVWAAFGTTDGYFRLNRHRLESLVAEIQTVPAITSLQMGHDGAYRSGDGGTVVYDSYRFLNGHLVTHYPAQARPDPEQPTVDVDDLLRRLNVPRTRYDALRSVMERMSLGSYRRYPDGRIALFERGVGGTPWVAGYLYGPGGETAGVGFMEYRRLAPHWARIVEG